MTFVEYIIKEKGLKFYENSLGDSVRFNKDITQVLSGLHVEWNNTNINENKSNELHTRRTRSIH